MKVTVIIPVYNTAPYITRCLKSVLDQTYDNLEVLLIDDCGTDNSMELAAGLLAQAGYRDTGGGSMQADSARTFTVLRHPENRGLSAARNTGLKAATGEYVVFLDSDDQLPPKAIENLVRMAELYS
ncbi:MAG: glycosyltransferase family 2 protein, partial [Bacteroidales bacterium]